MKERKIPTKNYIIYGAIVVVTLLAVFYLNEWYKAYKVSQLNNSYIASHVQELNYEEFKNYAQENPNGIVYIGITDCNECLDFEKKLYNVLKSYDLVDSLVFLNLTDLKIQNNYLNIVEKDYYSNISTPLNNLPSLAIMRNGKIVDIIVSEEDIMLEKSNVVNLLERQEYIK